MHRSRIRDVVLGMFTVGPDGVIAVLSTRP